MANRVQERRWFIADLLRIADLAAVVYGWFTRLVN